MGVTTGPLSDLLATRREDHAHALLEVLGFLRCGETLKTVVNIEAIMHSLNNVLIYLGIFDYSLECIDGTTEAGGSSKWEDLPFIHL